mmetsp:Transcript_12932/g.35473  ORF Transcript_12932/g.35473 Transcript_12932/m.35473 type:complete len:258 (-) Transcript_12932:5318-6091(-)
MNESSRSLDVSRRDHVRGGRLGSLGSLRWGKLVKLPGSRRRRRDHLRRALRRKRRRLLLLLVEPSFGHAGRVLRLLVLRRREPDEHLLERRLRHRVVIHQASLVGSRRRRHGIFAVDVHDGLRRFRHRANLLDRREDLPQLGGAAVVDAELELGVVALHDLRVNSFLNDGVVHDPGESGLEPDVHGVPFAEPVLQVLQGPEALELPADHDPDAVAQRLAFLHRVRREHDGPTLGTRGDDVPHEPTRLWIHAGGRLVE